MPGYVSDSIKKIDRLNITNSVPLRSSERLNTSMRNKTIKIMLSLDLDKRSDVDQVKQMIKEVDFARFELKDLNNLKQVLKEATLALSKRYSGLKEIRVTKEIQDYKKDVDTLEILISRGVQLSQDFLISDNRELITTNKVISDFKLTRRMNQDIIRSSKLPEQEEFSKKVAKYYKSGSLKMASNETKKKTFVNNNKKMKKSFSNCGLSQVDLIFEEHHINLMNYSNSKMMKDTVAFFELRRNCLLNIIIITDFLISFSLTSNHKKPKIKKIYKEVYEMNIDTYNIHTFEEFRINEKKSFLDCRSFL